MRVRSLELTDFRCYHRVEVSFTAGLTAIVGENGQGKTNLLEAIGWLAGLGSFRGAPDDALIRTGADTAVLRATIEADDGREQLIEAELHRVGRNRVQVNRQRVNRMRDLLGVVQVTVFSPDDLELVKAGPSLRRRWIDDALLQRHPRHDALRADLERILKQRNALLRSAPGRLDADAAFTLDVWDQKLSDIGSRLREAREELLDELRPALTEAYAAVANRAVATDASYEASWDGSLEAALAAVRDHDVRRGVSTIGPHRDEIVLTIDGRPARTHASQGEQRSLALALRLAADRVVRTGAGTSPVLLLDDVFSELDPGRAAALLDALPDAQRLLTTAAGLPVSATPERVLTIADGTVSVVGGGAVSGEGT